jgi:hypothetical protein
MTKAWSWAAPWLAASLRRRSASLEALIRCCSACDVRRATALSLNTWTARAINPTSSLRPAPATVTSSSPWARVVMVLDSEATGREILVAPIHSAKPMPPIAAAEA